MKKDIVSTDKAPSAIGPYSQGVRVNGFIFFSGQIPIDPSTGEIVAGGISIQAEQVMQNIEALLDVSGICFDNVVKSTIFLTNLADFGIVNDIYGQRFTAPYPARSTVQVSALPKGVAIEIEVVALAA